MAWPSSAQRALLRLCAAEAEAGRELTELSPAHSPSRAQLEQSVFLSLQMPEMAEATAQARSRRERSCFIDACDDRGRQG